MAAHARDKLVERQDKLEVGFLSLVHFIFEADKTALNYYAAASLVYH